MEDLGGQVSNNAAVVYEEYFVPALFRQWAPGVAELAKINSNYAVLDVACGTGILARYIKENINPDGNIFGIDPNENMIAIASKIDPDINWKIGLAESLPYKKNSFDAVVSQFGLMFFNDQVKALKEMYRVLKPQQYMAVAVWDKLENSPGYLALTELLKQQFGKDVADKLRAPFLLGDKDEFNKLFLDAGISNTKITTLKGSALFPSIRTWIFTDVRGWVFSDQVDDKQLDKLTTEAQKQLRNLVDNKGNVRFEISAHIAVAQKEQELKPIL